MVNLLLQSYKLWWSRCVQCALSPATDQLKQCYLFSLKKWSLLQRPAQILSAAKAKISWDLEAISPPTCAWLPAALVLALSSALVPQAHKHLQGQGRSPCSTGEGNVLFPFLWKCGGGVLLVFFLSRGANYIMLFQTDNQHNKEDGWESCAEVNPPNTNTGGLGSDGWKIAGTGNRWHHKDSQVSHFLHQRV